MKVRSLALVVSVLALGAALAAPLSGASSSAYSLTTLRHMLIGRTDLPTGWNIGQLAAPIDDACSAIMSSEHLMGTNSVAATFSYPSRHVVAFEYLAYRTDVVDAFERADTAIYTFGSCRDSANGVVVDSAVNDGTIETRTFGTWSDADRYNYRIGGSSGQLGYVVVRDKRFLLIVGLENRGILELNTMEGLTEKALARLPVS
jgi:hypothetical protein